MLSRDLLQLLACPACRGPVAEARGRPGPLECERCARQYGVRDGIPVLVRAETVASSPHKQRQIEFFDEESADDFGVTRPRGAPRLYRWLLEEKFRRSVIGIEHLLPGALVLVTCGGSGIDAEFLAAAGARVIVSDISVGVLLQARERARRHDLEISLVAADAEALPFRDRSVDLAYVHDGLHHLERPEAAVAELARVARSAVSITEPARAAVTGWAVRLGLAEAQEEAGNPVRRLTVNELVFELDARGFRALRPHRYAMYYRHWPGRAVRVLSKPLLFQLATGAIWLVNRVAGRLGNKLTVQAVRERA